MNKFRRKIYLSDVQIESYYRYQDWFQICPAPENAPRPPYSIGQHPFVLEFVYVPPIKPRILEDGTKLPLNILDNEESEKAGKEICLILSTLSQYHFFQLSSTQSWFTSLDSDKLKAQWGQKFYRVDNFDVTINSFTKPSQPVQKIETLEYYSRDSRSLTQVFDLPMEITIYLDSYHNLNDEAKSCFLAACTFFSQALGIATEYPSMSFASVVTAIETLIAYNYKNIPAERCDECGQERYRVVKKFKDFFTKYGSDTREFKSFAQTVYDYRSGLLHKGKLMFDESSIDKFGVYENLEKYFIRSDLFRVSRLLIVNWLLGHTR